MSKAAKLRLLYVAAAIIVAAVAIGIYQQVSRHPSDSVLLSGLSVQANSTGWTFSAPKRQENIYSDGRVTGSFTAKAVLKESLYQKVDTTSFLKESLSADTDKLAELRASLNTSRGQKLQELAHITLLPKNPLDVVLIKEVAARGLESVYEGNYEAEKHGSNWIIRYHGGVVNTPYGALPRSQYDTSVLDAKDPNTTPALKAMLEANTSLEKNLSLAREQLEELLRKEHGARTATFAALLKPGTLFTGSAVQRYNQRTFPIWIELTSVSTSPGQVQALMRNDGGWSDARTFQGEWKTDANAEKCVLVLRTHSNQAIREAGPFLETDDSWTITFTVGQDGAIEATNDSYGYRLTRIPDADAAAVQQKLQAPLQSLLAAAAAGTTYQGAIISKRDQTSEPVLLRFTKLDNNGALLAATLESVEHPSWRRSLRGTIIANTYRAGALPVRLKITSGDEIKTAPNGSVFRNYNDRQIGLTPINSALRGEDDTYKYELIKLNDQQLAELAATRLAREKQVLSVATPGATYDGTIRDDSGFVARARLRFVKINPNNGDAFIVMESRDQAGIQVEFKGTLDCAEGILSLQSGAGKFNPNGRLRVPFFSRDDTFVLNLAIKDDVLSGKIARYDDWTLNFPLKASPAPTAEIAPDPAPTTPEATTPNAEPATTPTTAPVAATPPATSSATIPSTPGAYILIDGKWEPLPTNNGKVKYGAGAVLSQVNSFLGALSERKPANTHEKLADLIFDGTASIPTARGDDIVIVFVGTFAAPPESVINKNPEILNYPMMEVARTEVRSDGKRRIDLLRIVPGIAGFCDQRVAAKLEKLAEGVTKLTCTGTLEPGMYALSVSNASTPAFEFRVR